MTGEMAGSVYGSEGDRAGQQLLRMLQQELPTSENAAQLFKGLAYEHIGVVAWDSSTDWHGLPGIGSDVIRGGHYAPPDGRALHNVVIVERGRLAAAMFVSGPNADGRRLRYFATMPYDVDTYPDSQAQVLDGLRVMLGRTIFSPLQTKWATGFWRAYRCEETNMSPTGFIWPTVLAGVSVKPGVAIWPA